MSNETNFTAGPWEFEKRGEHLVGLNGKDVEIWGCGLINANRTDECVANSALIKSAPKMYAMLEKQRDIFFRMSEEELVSDSMRVFALFESKSIENLLAEARGDNNV